MELLKWVVTVVIIPALGYIVREIKNLSTRIEHISTKVEIVNTTLVGQDGQNGLRSRFNQVEDEINLIKGNMHDLALGFAERGITLRKVDLINEKVAKRKGSSSSQTKTE